MKNGTKVKIKDGSYMLTVHDGQLTHYGISGGRGNETVIGWCEDTFTVLDGNGIYPSNNHNDRSIKNNTLIVNDSNGEIWFCDAKINLSPVLPRLTMYELYDIVGYEFELI
jgi:hypothetical protein